MASYNRVLLMGNLTRDPQLRHLPSSQTAVCDFGLACNRKFKTSSGEDREEVLFVDCTAWGRQGEVINQYFQKGKPIFIEGRLRLETWDDRQGGGKRSKITVVVDNFQFIGGRDEGGGGGGGGGGGDRSQRSYDDSRGSDRQASGPSRDQAPASRQPVHEPFDDQEQFADDDIPF